MIRFVIIGVWACLVGLGSSYAAAWYAAGTPRKGEEPYLAGLEYRRLPAVTVPMIVDGKLQGYVLAKFVITADAAELRRLPLEPTVFAVNAAFSEIYVNGRIESGKITKYNLPEMLGRIKTSTNTYLKGEVIREVLVDSLNYIDKTDMRSGVGVNVASAPGEKPAGKSGDKSGGHGEADAKPKGGH